ncbi:MAG: molybdate ABC transporter permease subunit [Coriobacteriales bacterium]|nr:molybdate ABC transporter permease subunit [Coriobacteriales bacterium]
MTHSAVYRIVNALLFVLLLGSVPALPQAALAVEQTQQEGAEQQAADEAVSVSQNNDAAKMAGFDSALSAFARYNSGTGRSVGGVDYGYRYPLAGADALAVLAVEGLTYVYVPDHIAAQFHLDIRDSQVQAHVAQLLEALDVAVSNGGTTLLQLAQPYAFTSESRLNHDGFAIEFGVEVEPGYFYTLISSSDSSDPSHVAYFAETALLVPADSFTIDAAPEGLEAFWNFLGGIDYRPFWVSLRTSAVALIFVFILGLGAARLSLRMNNRVKDVLDSVFTIPMVLPPTVCGFLLLVAFGNSTAFGRWLIDHGIELVFTWPAAVIAAIVVAFPLMYRTTRGAFEAQDSDMLDAARTLGWSEGRIFFRLMLPLAWPSIAAGTVLAFARAMGEFGATLFVAGNYAGVTQTMPIAIYFQWMGGRTDIATFWVFVVVVISFIVILFINLYASHTQRFRKGSGSGAATDAPSDPSANQATNAVSNGSSASQTMPVAPVPTQTDTL